ncbi:lipoprotein [Thiovulum sp. ES]|nr:lipoprotein [Thiovulum sp. ES]
MLNKILLFTVSLLFLSSCGGDIPNPLKSDEVVENEKVPVGKKYRGFARWNEEYMEGEIGITNELFNMNYITASHRTLPIDTMLFVKSLEKDRSIIVRISSNSMRENDIALELSKMTSERLGIFGDETALVEYKVIGYEQKFDENYLAGDVKLPSPDSAKNIEAILEENSEQSEEDKADFVLTKVELDNTIVDEEIEIKETPQTENNESKIENKTEISATLSIIRNSDLDSDNDLEVELPKANEDFQESNNTYELSDFKVINNDEVSEKSEVIEQNTTSSVENNETNKTVVEKKPVKTEYKRVYYVQLGAYESLERAESFIKEKNVTMPEPLKIIVREDGNFFKVWVSGFTNEDGARKFSSEKKYFDSSFLVWREEEVIIE